MYQILTFQPSYLECIEKDREHMGRISVKKIFFMLPNYIIAISIPYWNSLKNLVAVKM